MATATSCDEEDKGHKQDLNKPRYVYNEAFMYTSFKLKLELDMDQELRVGHFQKIFV